MTLELPNSVSTPLKLQVIPGLYISEVFSDPVMGCGLETPGPVFMPALHCPSAGIC
jgi:hypothetical protein